MLKLIIGKGRQVRVYMQVMDMSATDTALVIALVHVRHVWARGGSSFVLIIILTFVSYCRWSKALHLYEEKA